MKGLILSEEKRFFIVGSNDNNFVRVSKKSFKDKQYGEEIVYSESDLYVPPFKRLLSLNIFRSNILVYGVVTAILLLGLNIVSYDTETKQFSLKEDPFGLMSAFDSGHNNSIAYKEKGTSIPSLNSSLKGKDKKLEEKMSDKESNKENLLNTSKEGMVAINNSDTISAEKKSSIQIAEPKLGSSLISEPSLLKISDEENGFLQESTGLDGVNVDSKTVDIANFLRSSNSIHTGITTEIIEVNDFNHNSDSDVLIKRTKDTLKQRESGSLVAVIDKPSKDFNKEITSGSGILEKPSDKGNGLPNKEDTKNPGEELPKPPVQKPVVVEPTDNKPEEKPHTDEEEDTNTGKDEGSKPYNPNVPIDTEDGMVAGSDYEKELEKNNHGNNSNNGNQGNGNGNGNQGESNNQGNNGNGNGNQGESNNQGNNDNGNGNQGESNNQGNNDNGNGNQGESNNQGNNDNGNGNQGNNETENPGETEQPTMPTPCGPDGYYYGKEMVLFFEPDENGNMVEVWREIEVKKICN